MHLRNFKNLHKIFIKTSNFKEKLKSLLNTIYMYDKNLKKSPLKGKMMVFPNDIPNVHTYTS